MFSGIDNIIFPDSCEVIEIVPSQLYVYPIFKNGSSSLHETQKHTHWTSINNEQINDIKSPITVYLRDPRERFISGVNTYVQHCHRDFENLDTKTILHFVQSYLFLNRHYAPQFFWLINLARYSSALLHLQALDSINQVVKFKHRAEVEPPSLTFLSQIERFPWKQLELYFFLDQLLIDRIGQTVSFAQLVHDIQSDHPDLYQLVFQKHLNLAYVLSKT